MLFIFSTPVIIRHLWQLKTIVFLHWCLIRTVLLHETINLVPKKKMNQYLGLARHHLRRHRRPLQCLLPRHLRLQRPRHFAERQLIHFRRQKRFRGEQHFVDDVRRDVRRR